jgi:hypothetical protein
LIVHFADSEANSYVRCHKFIAEPGRIVAAYDEPKWARALDYHAQSTADALVLFKYLRRRSFLLLKDLPDAAWANTSEQSENGTMRMDDWLDIYDRQIPVHLEQMLHVYAAWKRNSHRSR